MDNVKWAKRQARLAEVRADRVTLALLFPECFNPPGSRQSKRPLKIGIAADLLAALEAMGSEISKERMRRAIGDYCLGPRYQRALAAGGPRYALDVSVAGEVLPEQQEFAKVRLPGIEEAAARRSHAARHERRRQDEAARAANDTAPQIARSGGLDMQICVPADWTDEQAKEFAETNNRCGTEPGWSVRKAGSPFLAGAPERAQCVERDGFVHITLDA